MLEFIGYLGSVIAIGNFIYELCQKSPRSKITFTLVIIGLFIFLTRGSENLKKELKNSYIQVLSEKDKLRTIKYLSSKKITKLKKEKIQLKKLLRKCSSPSESFIDLDSYEEGKQHKIKLHPDLKEIRSSIGLVKAVFKIKMNNNEITVYHVKAKDVGYKCKQINYTGNNITIQKNKGIVISRNQTALISFSPKDCIGWVKSNKIREINIKLLDSSIKQTALLQIKTEERF